MDIGHRKGNESGSSTYEKNLTLFLREIPTKIIMLSLSPIILAIIKF